MDALEQVQVHAERVGEDRLDDITVGHGDPEPLVAVLGLDPGVNLANALTVTPQDEFDAGREWAAFASEHGVELAVCVAAALRRAAAPVILLANKCEGGAGESALADAYSLGLGEPIPFSAEHGEGLGLLYDAFRPFIDAAREEPASLPEPAISPASEVDSDAALQLAIVGRPNVGKSTLINRLIGDERLVTGPEAGIP